MSSLCAYYNQNVCRSCDLLEMDYLDQLRLKEKNLLQHLGPVQLLPSVPSQIISFRNKAKFSVTGTLDHPTIGLLGEKSLDEGREILSCPIHHPKINEVLPVLKGFIQEARLAPYQIESRSGELKGIILFYSDTSQEMYIRFIVRSKESLDRIKKYSEKLKNQFPFITCISINIQPIAHAILEGDEEVYLTEKKFVVHRLKEFSFEINPQAFVQTNQQIAERLYQTAADWTKDLSPEKFTELYSGQGAFSFFVSSFVKKSLGIEINNEAVKKANQMAKDLHLDHLSFICSDASLIEQELEKFNPDVVLVNPPRKGLGKSVHLFTQKIYPYILYSSCSHETLGEDLKILSPLYHIEKAQIFDMFPHTNHFETLVLLKRK